MISAVQAIRSNCRRLYAPSLHLWYRPIAPTISTNHMWIVQIGLSERGIRELGDIERITPCTKLTDVVKTNEALLELGWSREALSSADEMYHSVWENVEGKLEINSPVDGEVDYVIASGDDTDENPAATGIADDDQVLVEVRTSRESLQEAIFPLVDKTQYEQIVADIPPGIFGRGYGVAGR